METILNLKKNKYQKTKAPKREQLLQKDQPSWNQLWWESLAQAREAGLLADQESAWAGWQPATDNTEKDIKHTHKQQR